MSQTNTNLEIGVALQTPANKPSININLAHELLGHHGEVQTRQITKALGITLTQRTMEVYKACAIAKTKQKNTTHKPQGRGKSTLFNEKVYSDLSFIYNPNQKQAYKYVWHLMINSATGLGTEGFNKAKFSFIEPACQQLQIWKLE